MNIIGLEVVKINLFKSISFLFSILAITTTLSLGSMIFLIFLLPFISVGIFFPRTISNELPFPTLRLASFFSQGIVSALLIEILASAITLIKLYFENASGEFIVFNTILSFLLLPLFVREIKTNSILREMKDNYRDLWLKSLEE